jgi:alkyl sulfatase BDS1-like metallo-beta-lactamase superfamily hydrolase
MADFRLLGNEVTLRLTSNGALLSEITTIKDLTAKIGIKLLSEGYLGEMANRHREIFEECSGTFNIVPENEAPFTLQQQIYSRARQAGAADVQINLGVRLAFPSGTIFRLTFPDLHFETIGDFNQAGRDSFASMAWAWKSTKYIPSF